VTSSGTLTKKIYVEGELVSNGIRSTTVTLPDGSLVNVTFSNWDNSPMIILESSGSRTIHAENLYITNNHIDNTPNKKKTKNSDMERILIKNAKIDALASIDPNKTDDAKEKIQIVKELDKLND
jgi:hypothetical protein